MLAIYRKDIKSYASSMLTYVLVAALLLSMGLFTVIVNLWSGYTEFASVLVAMKWVLLAVIPILTMRLIAEERHNRTDLLIYSLPIPMRSIVFGKFLAAVTVFLIPTAVSALYPLLLSLFGEVSLAASYTALLGYFLMACALIALCLFVSSLVENQILALVLGVVSIVLFCFMTAIAEILPSSSTFSFVFCTALVLLAGLILIPVTKNTVVSLLLALILDIPTVILYLVKPAMFESLVPRVLEKLDVFARMNGFVRGYLDVKGVVFYLGFTAFFLFLTVWSAERRRLV